MDHQTFSVLAEFKDHPGMFTVLCIVIVLCVFMTVSLPRVLKFMLAKNGSRIQDDQHMSVVLARLDALDSYLNLSTSKLNDMQTELQVMLAESRSRDMRIAAMTLNGKDMPLWDRMDAALVYFANGGNHNAEVTIVDAIMSAPDAQHMAQLWFDKVANFKRQLPKEPLDYIHDSLKAVYKKLV